MRIRFGGSYVLIHVTARLRSPNLSAAWLAAAALLPAAAHAELEALVEDDVVVLGRWDNPLGASTSASEGVVGATEIDARPRMRTGEILEVVPGLIVTQH